VADNATPMDTASTLDTTTKRRASIFVLLTVFIYSVGFGIIMPVLPSLILELNGGSLSEAAALGAWIGAAYAIFQFLMGPLVGNLGDRYGRRPVFLFSLAGFGLDFLLMGLAPSVAWLFVGRSIAGGLGAIFGPANSAMADMSAPEERAASFGKVAAAFGFGFIMGPALGGLISDYGTRLPFFIAGGLAFANCIYGYFIFPETMPKERRRNFDWKRANPFGALRSLKQIDGVLPIATIYFLWVLAINVYPSSWSFFAPAQYGWDSKMVGFSLTLVGISMAVTQSMLIGRVVKKFGEPRAAIFGIMAGITMFVIYAFLTNPKIAIILTLFNGISGMATPAINAMMSQKVPPDRQGELQGLNGSLSALSFLFAQLIYNNVLAHFISDKAPIAFPGAPFAIAALFSMVAFIGLLNISRRQRAAL
jgi:MFS transporter, DHA1 family, tetracycline resistance protein